MTSNKIINDPIKYLIESGMRFLLPPLLSEKVICLTTLSSSCFSLLLSMFIDF